MSAGDRRSVSSAVVASVLFHSDRPVDTLYFGDLEGVAVAYPTALSRICDGAGFNNALRPTAVEYA